MPFSVHRSRKRYFASYQASNRKLLLQAEQPAVSKAALNNTKIVSTKTGNSSRWLLLSINGTVVCNLYDRLKGAETLE